MPPTFFHGIMHRTIFPAFRTRKLQTLAEIQFQFELLAPQIHFALHYPPAVPQSERFSKQDIGIHRA